MSKLKTPEVSDEIARQMLDRAEAVLPNTYPNRGKGYSVSVLSEKGNIYEGVSYNSDTLTLFGNLFNLEVIADESLFKNETIVFNAGRTTSIGMKSVDYKELVQPTIRDII